MKRNIKRTVLGLAMAVSLLALSACGKIQSADDGTAGGSEAAGEIRSQLEVLPAGYLQLFDSLGEKDAKAFKEQMSAQPQFEALAAGVDAWESIRPDLGKLISVEDAVAVTDTSDGYEATVHGIFEKREMDFSVTVDPGMTKIISVNFSPEYTSWERIKKGEYNGAAGVGVIALGLLLAGLFKYAAVTKRVKKAALEEEAVRNAKIQQLIDAGQVSETENLELIAVITAAIAAAAGAAPEDLVVRSIRRSAAQNWKNA